MTGEKKKDQFTLYHFYPYIQKLATVKKAVSKTCTFFYFLCKPVCIVQFYIYIKRERDNTLKTL